jgi:hypothetical protein
MTAPALSPRAGAIHFYRRLHHTSSLDRTRRKMRKMPARFAGLPIAFVIFIPNEIASVTASEANLPFAEAQSRVTF